MSSVDKAGLRGSVTQKLSNVVLKPPLDASIRLKKSYYFSMVLSISC